MNGCHPAAAGLSLTRGEETVMAREKAQPDTAASRAFEARMPLRETDIAAIEAAHRSAGSSAVVR